MHPLQPNISYHIFNHANGCEELFSERENYRFFMQKYRRYISPIAETYAYCLLPNHFHFIVRMRKKAVIEELVLKKKAASPKFKTLEKLPPSDKEIEVFLSKQFGNLFSSYSQSFNKMYHRIGSVFVKNFKREPVLNKAYFVNAVVYCHRNPVHHNFRDFPEDWEASSYNEIINNDSNLVEIDKLLAVFGGMDSFILKHNNSLGNFTDLELKL